MTRFYVDTEFHEDGRIIDLVSLAIVSEHGDKYYAVNRNVHWEALSRPNPTTTWLRENVWPHLPLAMAGGLSLNINHPDVKSKIKIASEVEEFIKKHSETEPQLWAFWPAYDTVALAQLWGCMKDMPTGIPRRINCLAQMADSLGVSENDFPIQDPETVHHALFDAIHDRRIHQWLINLAGSYGLQINEDGRVVAAS